MRRLQVQAHLNRAVPTVLTAKGLEEAEVHSSQALIAAGRELYDSNLRLFATRFRFGDEICQTGGFCAFPECFSLLFAAHFTFCAPEFDPAGPGLVISGCPFT